VSLQANVQASQIVRWQGMFALVLGLVVIPVAGWHTALATFTGALACWVPTLLIVRVLFPKGRFPRSSIALFFTIEICRLLLMALFLILAFSFFSDHRLAVLGGFAATLVAFQAASLLMMTGWKSVLPPKPED